MERVTTIEAVRAAVAGAGVAARRVALVPTMGALHDGHLELVSAAAARTEGEPFVIVSIFVNPTQFAPGEDYQDYPRDLEADEAALSGLADAAPALVYAPTVREMYPDPPEDGAHLATTVRVARLTGRLCGAHRPGHFDGVCTVVSKLLHQVGPDVAYFGRKDFQQLQVIRRMVRDLDIPVDIRGVRTVREDDGLAMSSRNAYLDPHERRAARALSAALGEAVHAARDARAAGEEVRPDVLREAAAGKLDAEPMARTEYVEVVDPRTLEPRSAPPDEAADGGSGQEHLVAVAAYVGEARLIDNVVVGEPDDEQHLLDAVAGGS